MATTLARVTPTCGAPVMQRSRRRQCVETGLLSLRQRRVGSWSAAARRLRDLAMPVLELEQCPQAVRVIGPPIAMLANKTFDLRTPEVAPFQRRRIKKHVARQIAQLIPEPVHKRHAEAHFVPVENRVWEDSAKRRLQDALSLTPVQLLFGRQ